MRARSWRIVRVQAVQILLACMVGASSVGCTFYGAYDAPRAEPESIEQLQDRIRARDTASPFVVVCEPGSNAFGCAGLVSAVERALLAAGMTPSTQHSSAPGAFALEVRSHAGDLTGWIGVTILTAGLVPSPLDGAAVQIDGAVVGPCGERLSVEVEDPLRAWLSGPFLPSAWLGGRGVRGGALYKAKSDYSGRQVMEEAHAHLSRRAVLKLLDKLDSTPGCATQ